jgi:hypothetical protein
MTPRILASALCACLLSSTGVYAQTQDLTVGAVGHLEGHEVDGSIAVDRQTETSDSEATEAAPDSAESEASLDLKGRLLALKEKAVKHVLHRGVSLDESFNLSEFLHLGIEVGTYVVKPSRLLPEQKEALERHPGTVWIATDVEGGIRLPFVSTFPVTDTLNFTVGTTPGARLTYHVVDSYEIPDGVTDVSTFVDGLKSLSKRAFDLPLSASEARAQTLGSHRAMHGEMSVAVRGALGIGYDLADFGDVVQMGASARAGGFYVFKNTMELKTTRLEGSSIRLRVRDGQKHERGATAALLIGASVDRNALRDEFIPSVEYLEPLANVVAGEARGHIKDVLRFRIGGERGWVRGNELDLSFRFDLSVPAAAHAYERAMRGDLTVAGALGDVPDSGVLEEFRVLEVEDKTYRKGEITISVLFEAGFEKRLSAKDLVVEDADGVNHYEVFRFDRRRRVSFFDRRWDRRLHVEVIGKANDEATELAESSFRFRYTIRDASTRIGEVRELRRAIASWNLVGTDEASLPTPERRFLRSRYGRTDTSLAVDVSERGLESIFNRDLDALRGAYLEACQAIDDKAPGWGDRRAAKRFAEALSGLASATSRADRAKRIGLLAEGSDWDLYTITAIVSLAPAESLRLRASILGTRVSYSNGHTGDRFVDRTPALHGH